MQATGIGGVGGISKYPPLAENFGKYPPPGDFGKIFWKTGKNGEN